MFDKIQNNFLHLCFALVLRYPGDVRNYIRLLSPTETQIVIFIKH